MCAFGLTLWDCVRVPSGYYVPEGALNSLSLWLENFCFGKLQPTECRLRMRAVVASTTGNIRKCQLGWSFEVPWGECSCVCNPAFLFGQTASITWQLMESRLTLYLCRCGCMLSIAWGPGILSVAVPAVCVVWRNVLSSGTATWGGCCGLRSLFTLSTEHCLSFLQPLRVSWQWRASELGVPLRNAYSSWNNMYLSAWDVLEWFPG